MSTTPPRCPHCGFTVFTNRYPKCEKCGEALPSNLVLSKEQLKPVLAQEWAERDAARKAAYRKERDRAGGAAGGGTAADAGDGLLGSLLDLSDVLPDLDFDL